MVISIISSIESLLNFYNNNSFVFLFITWEFHQAGVDLRSFCKTSSKKYHLYAIIILSILSYFPMQKLVLIMNVNGILLLHCGDTGSNSGSKKSYSLANFHRNFTILPIHTILLIWILYNGMEPHIMLINPDMSIGNHS